MLIKKINSFIDQLLKFIYELQNEFNFLVLRENPYC